MVITSWFPHVLPLRRVLLLMVLTWIKTWAKLQKSPRLKVLKKASPGVFKSYYFCLFIHAYMCCNNLFLCAFKFSGFVYNHRCMFLGSNAMFTQFISTRCLADRTGKSRVVSCYSRDYRSWNAFTFCDNISTTSRVVVLVLLCLCSGKNVKVAVCGTFR